MSPASTTHLDNLILAGTGRIASVARAVVLATFAGSLLTACETMNSTMESVTSSVKSMNLFSDDEKSDAEKTASGSSPAGAGVAPVAPGEVASYMDEQERKLRAQLAGTGVTILREGNVITLNMPGSATFASGSSNLDERARPVLDSVVVVIDEYPQTYVDVVGHTDSKGPTAYNKRLSELRAQSVARYLEERRVDRQRLVAEGKGEDAPIASNETSEGRALNRRVEIRLRPVS